MIMTLYRVRETGLGCSFSRQRIGRITDLEDNMWYRTYRLLTIFFLISSCWSSVAFGQEHTQAGIDVHPDVLDEYVGEYLIFPGFTMKVDRDGSQLFAQPTAQKRTPLTATEPDRFFVALVDGSLTFERDDKGKVVAMVIKQGDSEGYGKRISCLDPKDVAQARDLMQAGKVDELKAKFEALAENPEKEVDALLVLCELLNTKEHYEEAMAYGNRAVTVAPEHARAHFLHAQTQKSKLQFGNMFAGYQAAQILKAELRQAVTLAPENLAYREAEIEFYTEAVAPLGGSTSHARKLVEELTGLDKARGLVALGKIFDQEEDYDNAVKNLEAALVLAPDSNEAKFRLGYVLQKTEKYLEAEKILDSVSADGNQLHYYQALYQLAKTKILRGEDIPKAIEILERYIAERPDYNARLYPSKSDACWRLGKGYEVLGQLEKAKASYERALTLVPVSRNAQTALDAINKILAPDGAEDQQQ